MRRAFWTTLLGVMLILSGIFCLFSLVTSSTVIPYMIGIALTATGIGKLMRRADERRFYGQSSLSLAGAVVSLIFGILLMVSPTLQLSMGTTVVVLIGCWITIMGILRIVHAFQLRKVTASLQGDCQGQYSAVRLQRTVSQKKFQRILSVWKALLHPL